LTEGLPEVEFSEAAVRAESERRSGGLRDYGDDAFVEPMRRLLDALEHEAGLNAVGRVTQFERVVGLLVNRLRTEDAIARHPEILAEELAPPVVVVGLGRTGTTMLHRMLASDPHFYSLAWYESRNPAPFPESQWGPDGVDPRIRDAEAEVEAMLAASPDLIAAHPMDAHAPDEEVMLVEHAFTSPNPEAFCHIPRFGRWLAEQDHAPGYRYLERLLRFLQWQKRRRGIEAERWILKSPCHLGHCDLLLDTFPGARIVLTHRDPVQTIPSFASLVHSIAVIGNEHVDPEALAAHWCAKIAREARHCLAVHDAHPEAFLDLQYADLVAGPLAQVQRIYDFAGLELTDDARAGMQRWAEENARDRRPVHRYTLEQFGLDEAGLREQFAEYRERFVVGEEAVAR